MFFLLRYIPKNHLSYFAGKVARLRLPAAATSCLIGWFARRYGVNLDEAEFPADQYATLADFFIRNLKPGSRPVRKGVTSPVDGRVVEFGNIEDGKLVQVKGKLYSLSELLGDEETARRYQGGYYITIYLAPGDYHHIHAPISGALRQTIYIEGALWPVNNWSVTNIDNLFVQNERVIAEIDDSVLVVMVGATNVGSISLAFDDLVTNTSPRLFCGRRGSRKRVYDAPVSVEKGARLGTFNLGSTVILVFKPGEFEPKAGMGAGCVKMGETVGAMKGYAGE